MHDTWIIDIGVVDSEGTGMQVHSMVALHDEEGTAKDDWVNDPNLAKIGDGGGSWTFMSSQGALLLWGKALEFQARLKDFPNTGKYGTIELAKPLNGSKVLSYKVRW